MPTGKEYLQTALDDVRRRISELIAAGPRPDMSIDGRSYAFNSQLNSLIENEQKLLVALQNADGPFEEVSFGN